MKVLSLDIPAFLFGDLKIFLKIFGPLGTRLSAPSNRAIASASDFAVSQGVVPALLQKLVGELFNFGEGGLAGNLPGIWGDFFYPTKIKAQKYRRKFRRFFCENS